MLITKSKSQNPNSTSDSKTQNIILRLSRWHFFYVLALAAQIIVFDAWALIEPKMVLRRWVATALLLTVTVTVWYFAHTNRPANSSKRLAAYLILADIAFAAFAVYTQRGMASRAVFLFIVPMLVATSLKRAAAVMATAVLCAATYVTSAVSYFVLNFNEGYKIELYGEVGFYVAMFIVVAGMIAALVSNSD